MEALYQRLQFLGVRFPYIGLTNVSSTDVSVFSHDPKVAGLRIESITLAEELLPDAAH